MENNKLPLLIQKARENRTMLYSQSNNLYFEHMRNIYEASAQRNFPRMIDYCLISYALIEPLLIHYKITPILMKTLGQNPEKYSKLNPHNPLKAVEQEFVDKHPKLTANDRVEGMSNFDIRYIPAITLSGEYYATMGLTGDLANLNDIVHYFDDLKLYRADINDFEQLYELTRQAKIIIEEQPGLSIPQLTKALVYDDDERIRRAVQLMNKYEIITLSRSENDFKIYIK